MAHGHAGIGMTSLRTRERLLERLQTKGIYCHAVLNAMRETPRHIFVDEALASRAYEDLALPIGFGQTISQPYIVARMTQSLFDRGKLGSVLEIGTGCGYQTAILSRLSDRVYSIERIEALMKMARKRFQTLGLNNIRLRHGDGMEGWADYAPYDGIVVTAAPAELPQALLLQLAEEGRMIIPIGSQATQSLQMITRRGSEFLQEDLESVRFVPMRGRPT